jgi:DNA polymerase-4
VAVGGDSEARHGIILAKNYEAKSYGIRTGESILEARRKCPRLVILPPHYDEYVRVSRAARKIYSDYTDLIESFGIDECWIDVTDSEYLFGGGVKIADEIRERIKRELGVTVSVGVSFNKVFAKLGSDYKKPDAVTVINHGNFRQIVWELPVEELLYVGRSSKATLNRVGIRTIGDLAACSESFLKTLLGKNGIMLKNFALGKDYAEVSRFGFEPEPKSVSNGMTFKANLVTDKDVSFAVTYLSMSVAERLRKHGLCCKTVSVTVKSVDQTSVKRSVRLERATCLFKEMSSHAYRLTLENRPKDGEIYAVSVHAENLVRQNDNHLQQRMFSSSDELRTDKLFSLESAVDSVRMKYGKEAIVIASSLNNPLLV